MATTRFVFRRPVLLFRDRGFLVSTRRWFYSPSPPSDGRNDASDLELSGNNKIVGKSGLLLTVRDVIANLRQGLVERTNSKNIPEIIEKEGFSEDTTDATAAEGINSIKNSDQTMASSEATMASQCGLETEASQETENSDLLQGCLRNLDLDHKSQPNVMTLALDKNASTTFVEEISSDVSLFDDQQDQFGKRYCYSLDESETDVDVSAKLESLELDGLEKDKLLKFLGVEVNHDKRTGGEREIRKSGNENTVLSETEGEEKVNVKGLLESIKHFSKERATDTQRIKPLSDSKGVKPEAEAVKSQSVSPANQKTSKKRQFTISAGEHNHNTVLVRFIRATIKKEDICKYLETCGEIKNVQEVASFEGCLYKDAFVTFGTREAAQLGLRKTGGCLRCDNVVVEPTCLEDREAEDRVIAPNVIGDPDVPVALVKEPARTVKIQHLSAGICSDQVKEALRFCGSNISRVFFGSSSSTAFVEFETEDAKERALEEHSIKVAGNQLFIYRIDVPRTTVVRFSRLSSEAITGLARTCKRYGEITRVRPRSEDTCDVYFKMSEWPNMLKILNSMNDDKLRVRPAPSIPPDILCVLMGDPRGREYVGEVIQRLVVKLGEPIDTCQIHSLSTQLLRHHRKSS